MNRRTFFAGLLAFAALVAPAHADERVLDEKARAYGSIIVTENAAGSRTLRFEKTGTRSSVVKPDDSKYLALRDVIPAQPSTGNVPPSSQSR